MSINSSSYDYPRAMFQTGMPVIDASLLVFGPMGMNMEMARFFCSDLEESRAV